MFTFLIIVELIISALLILVILMQSSKGGGLAGTFGGGSVGVVFGVRRTADFLIKGTQILAAAFVILALVINMFFLPRGAASQGSVLQHSSQQQPLTPQMPPQQAPVTAPPTSAPVGTPQK
jgi:preprotein translocase subunit SecG